MLYLDNLTTKGLRSSAVRSQTLRDPRSSGPYSFLLVLNSSLNLSCNRTLPEPWKSLYYPELAQLEEGDSLALLDDI